MMSPDPSQPDGAAAVETPLLVLEGVQRIYTIGNEKVAALNGIDLVIAAGEFVAIIGPSGSGKSTLLNILGCLDQPTTGDYRVAGQSTGSLDANALAALRRHTFGFVFQGYNLLPRLDARQNVELPAVYAHEAGASRLERADALLTRLGLGDRLHHRPAELSGGQQQRVCIARAMINGGTVILADEPTGALDSRTGEEMLALFRTLCDEGHTVLVVTHDQNVAAQADRVIEIADGCVRADRIISTRARSPLISPRRRFRGTIGLLMGREALRSAARTIAAHRLRNVLTMLGIVAGIASVILTVAIGDGSQRQILRQISFLGTNVSYIQAGTFDVRHGGAGHPTETLKASEIERLDAMPFLAGATTLGQRDLTIHYRSQQVKTTVYGVSATFFKIEGMPIVAGRSFSSYEVATSALDVVIDRLVEARLFEKGQNPINAIVFLGDVPARVIGIVAPRPNTRFGGSPFAAFPNRLFDQRLSRSNHIPAAQFGIADEFERGVAMAAVTRLLYAWHRAGDFTLVDLEEIRQARLRSKAILSIVTLSIAGIALLVAGLGVMNMMLVSVVERTREIGIMMAIGARRGDIMLQFLMESVLLCVGGGILGTLVAFAAGSAIVSSGLPVALDFSWKAVIYAVLVSSAAGLVAGVVPARRASRVNPIEALAR